jgi:hypothetical protein
MTIRMPTTWLTVALVAGALIARPAAQQAPPPPQIPQPIFRAPEDTRKTGVKPDEIKAGTRPDYTKLRDQLVVIPVQGRIHLIGGAGGNIAVQISDEGTLVVDTGDMAATAKVMAEIKKLGIRPVRWIINTSADLDHSGGNGPIAKAGVGAPPGGGAVGGGGGGGGGGNAFIDNGARPRRAPWTSGRPIHSSPRGRTSGTAASRSRCGTSRRRTATAT